MFYRIDPGGGSTVHNRVRERCGEIRGPRLQMLKGEGGRNLKTKARLIDF